MTTLKISDLRVIPRPSRSASVPLISPPTSPSTASMSSVPSPTKIRRRASSSPETKASVAIVSRPGAGGRSKKGPTSRSGRRHLAEGRCTNCNATKEQAVMWRRDPNSGAVLCNRCGLYIREHGLARPVASSGAKTERGPTPRARSKSAVGADDDVPSDDQEEVIEAAHVLLSFRPECRQEQNQASPPPRPVFRLVNTRPAFIFNVAPRRSVIRPAFIEPPLSSRSDEVRRRSHSASSPTSSDETELRTPVGVELTLPSIGADEKHNGKNEVYQRGDGT